MENKDKDNSNQDSYKIKKILKSEGIQEVIPKYQNKTIINKDDNEDLLPKKKENVYKFILYGLLVIISGGLIYKFSKYKKTNLQPEQTGEVKPKTPRSIRGEEQTLVKPNIGSPNLERKSPREDIPSARSDKLSKEELLNNLNIQNRDINNCISNINSEQVKKLELEEKIKLTYQNIVVLNKSIDNLNKLISEESIKADAEIANNIKKKEDYTKELIELKKQHEQTITNIGNYQLKLQQYKLDRIYFIQELREINCLQLHDNDFETKIQNALKAESIISLYDTNLIEESLDFMSNPEIVNNITIEIEEKKISEDGRESLEKTNVIVSLSFKKENLTQLINKIISDYDYNSKLIQLSQYFEEKQETKDTSSEDTICQQINDELLNKFFSTLFADKYIKLIDSRTQTEMFISESEKREIPQPVKDQIITQLSSISENTVRLLLMLNFNFIETILEKENLDVQDLKFDFLEKELYKLHSLKTIIDFQQKKLGETVIFPDFVHEDFLRNITNNYPHRILLNRIEKKYYDLTCHILKRDLFELCPLPLADEEITTNNLLYLEYNSENLYKILPSFKMLDPNNEFNLKRNYMYSFNLQSFLSSTTITNENNQSEKLQTYFIRQQKKQLEALLLEIYQKRTNNENDEEYVKRYNFYLKNLKLVVSHLSDYCLKEKKNPLQSLFNTFIGNELIKFSSWLDNNTVLINKEDQLDKILDFGITNQNFVLIEFLNKLLNLSKLINDEGINLTTRIENDLTLSEKDFLKHIMSNIEMPSVILTSTADKSTLLSDLQQKNFIYILNRISIEHAEFYNKNLSTIIDKLTAKINVLSDSDIKELTIDSFDSLIQQVITEEKLLLNDKQIKIYLISPIKKCLTTIFMETITDENLAVIKSKLAEELKKYKEQQNDQLFPFISLKTKLITDENDITSLFIKLSQQFKLTLNLSRTIINNLKDKTNVCIETLRATEGVSFLEGTTKLYKEGIKLDDTESVTAAAKVIFVFSLCAILVGISFYARRIILRPALALPPTVVTKQTRSSNWLEKISGYLSNNKNKLKVKSLVIMPLIIGFFSNDIFRVFSWSKLKNLDFILKTNISICEHKIKIKTSSIIKIQKTITDTFIDLLDNNKILLGQTNFYKNEILSKLKTLHTHTQNSRPWSTDEINIIKDELSNIQPLINQELEICKDITSLLASMTNANAVDFIKSVNTFYTNNKNSDLLLSNDLSKLIDSYMDLKSVLKRPVTNTDSITIAESLITYITERKDKFKSLSLTFIDGKDINEMIAQDEKYLTEISSCIKVVESESNEKTIDLQDWNQIIQPVCQELQKQPFYNNLDSILSDNSQKDVVQSYQKFFIQLKETNQPEYKIFKKIHENETIILDNNTFSLASLNKKIENNYKIISIINANHDQKLIKLNGELSFLKDKLEIWQKTKADKIAKQEETSSTK